MNYVEMMIAGIAVSIVGIPGLKTSFGKEFFYITKNSISAVLVLLLGFLILVFNPNAIIQHLTVVLMVVASVVQFCISNNNYVETIGDELVIAEDGEKTILQKHDISYRYERDNRFLIIEGKGKTVKMLAPACEKLENWLGIQR